MNYPPPQWAAWLLFGLGWFVAIVLTYHDLRKQNLILRTQLDEKRKRKEIRDTLGQLLEEGQQIKNKCFEKNIEPPTAEAEKWAEKVVMYLNCHLGSDYVQRFHSHEGLPIGVTTLSGIPATIESYIKTRLARLNQFLAELVQLG